MVVEKNAINLYNPKLTNSLSVKYFQHKWCYWVKCMCVCMHAN